MDVEAGMFPGEEVGEAAGADVFAGAEGVKEAVTEDAAEEVADDGKDVGAERAEGGAVLFLVGSEEGFPGGGEDLPEWGGAGAAGLVDGGHK